MKKKTLLGLFVGICLVPILGVPFLAGSSPAAAPLEPIKIGAVLDYTGGLAKLGPQFRDGIKLRFEEAGWKVAGRPIKLIIEDGATDTAVSLDKLKKLVGRDKTNIIYGPLMSQIGMAVSPYLVENKVISLCLISHPLEIKKYGNWLVYPGTLYSLGLGLGRYAYEELGYRTATTFGEDYVAGWRIIGATVDQFKEAGGTVVQQQWMPPSTADFGPYLSSMKKADVAMGWLWPGDIGAFIKQANEFGMKKPIIIADAGESPGLFFKTLGDLTLDIVGVSHYVWSIDNPENKKFVAAFENKYGRKPGIEAVDAYVLTSMILAALEATGGDTTFKKLHAALLKLKLDTPQGPLSFSPSGIAITNRYVVKGSVKNGDYAWKILDTIPNVSDPRD